MILKYLKPGMLKSWEREVGASVNAISLNILNACTHVTFCRGCSCSVYKTFPVMKVLDKALFGCIFFVLGCL